MRALPTASFPSEMSVVVRTFAKDNLVLSMLPDNTVADLKYAIFERWGVAPDCQHLYLDKVLMADSEHLIDFWQEGAARLLVHLRVELDMVYHQMGGLRPQARVGALKLFAKSASKGDTHAISSVTALLADQDPGVRKTAHKTLLAIADKGDQCAITTTCKRLENLIPEVRHAGLGALADVTKRGDEHVLELIRTRLEDDDERVRLGAVSAIIKVAKKGDHSQSQHWAFDWKMSMNRSGGRQLSV